MMPLHALVWLTVAVYWAFLLWQIVDYWPRPRPLPRYFEGTRRMLFITKSLKIDMGPNEGGGMTYEKFHANSFIVEGFDTWRRSDGMRVPLRVIERLLRKRSVKFAYLSDHIAHPPRQAPRVQAVPEESVAESDTPPVEAPTLDALEQILADDD